MPTAVIQRSEKNSEVNLAKKEFNKLEELSGKLASNPDEQKLMHSVLENDKDTIEDGNLINDSMNRGIGSFIPDLMFENITKNYSVAKKIYGESILRKICGYSSDYIKKNVNIPEFKRELKKRIDENIEKLKEKKLIDKENFVSETGFKLASIVLYTQELDNLIAKGNFGEKTNSHLSHYGEKDELTYNKNKKRYKDLAIKSTIRTSIRRSHSEIDKGDIRYYERKSKGLIYVVYGIDSSGSMTGKKIEIAKKAGVALAFKATEQKDKVGLIVFGTDVKEKVEPTRDFLTLLKEITMIRSGKETNIKSTIEEAIMMFPNENVTKHLVLITDALPNVGIEPEIETIQAAAEAANNGITISLIGIDLDKKGKDLAKKIVEVGQGKFYICKESDNIDQIILEDYYGLD